MTLGRILFLINSLGTGGAERSLAELLPRLAEAGVKPVVACLYRRPEGVERPILEAGYDVLFLSSSTTPGRVLEVRRVIHAVQPDLVHTTLFESDVIGRVAAWHTRVPVVTSLVNVTYGPERLLDPNVRRWKLQAVREIDGWTARRLTARFHAVSRSVKDSAVRSLRIPPDKVTVIERGRDPDRLGRPDAMRRQRVRRELGISEDAQVVVSVGRLEHQKGHRYLFDAVAKVGQRPHLTILVAGRDGHMSPELKPQVQRLGLEGRVRFLGHRNDVPDLLAAADLLALPSLNEGAAGVVIEAMALGVPVVASDLPSLREVTEDGTSGLLVPVASPDALARAIERLLDDQPLARVLGTRGREIFERRFTLDRSVKRMVGMYRSVLASSSTHSSAVREGV